MTEQKDSLNPICDGCDVEILGFFIMRGRYHFHPQPRCLKLGKEKGLIDKA